MRFRDVPSKEKLVILIPPELDEAIRDEAHSTRRSISEVASTWLVRGKGDEPTWTPKADRRIAS